MKLLGNRILKTFLVLTTFLLMAGIVSAVPQITIHSPESGAVYDSTQVFLNATSSEPVDFFIKDARGKRNVVLAENITELINYIYVNEGAHKFEIWANNSNGEANASVSFNTSVHNPVEITTCGYLSSSDTVYEVANDLTSVDTYGCLYIWNVRNISIDLKGHTVNGGKDRVLDTNYVSGIEVFNGTLRVSAAQTGGWYNPWVLALDGMKMNFHDLDMEGYLAMSIYEIDDVIFKNVFFNCSVGIWPSIMTNTHFVNSEFSWNHNGNGYVMWDISFYSEVYFEEVNMTGFPGDYFRLQGGSTDFYLRNTYLNMSKISYPSWPSETRFFKQHKVLFNVTDQLNKTGSGVIEIKDNSNSTSNSTEFDYDPNPTTNVLLATDENGYAETWLTEKVTRGRTSSPVTLTENNYFPYYITAKSWEGEETTIEFDLESNSTIPISLNITVPTAYPECTIAQLLDLNNDDTINMQDAVIVLRYIAGLPVSSSGSKECTGISLDPF